MHLNLTLFWELIQRANFTQPVNIRISSCESKICFKSCEYRSDKINITSFVQRRFKKKQIKRNIKIREEGSLRNVNEQIFSYLLRNNYGASLVAQWLRICLPVQGTRVWALVQEDPTCCGATKPVSHNYWAHVPGARAPQQEKPPQWEARALQQRVAPARYN